jgi:pseudouridine-5'-phosphate glycosidase
VALESTIFSTLGLPVPANAEALRRCQAAVRAGGAVPAVTAVLDGRWRVGLSPEQEQRVLLGTRKVAERDLAVAAAQEWEVGVTTVSASVALAARVGISVFATGGIGGVHRGAEQSFDISADLHELAQTPVTVVAAGAKAILDLPKTLEVLETLGVPVIAVGQDDLPAFWSRSSGLKAPLRMDDPAQIAAAHRMRRALSIPGGQLVANPIPDTHEIPAATLAPHIAQALREADDERIAAKSVTPFLLSRIFDLTGGRSLEANIELVLNNARLAARIAEELARLPS